MTRTLLLAALAFSACTDEAYVEIAPLTLDEWIEHVLPSYCPFSFEEMMMGEGTLELVAGESPPWGDPLFARSFLAEGYHAYKSDNNPDKLIVVHPAWLDLEISATSAALRYHMTLDASRFDDHASLLPEEYQLEAQGMEFAFPGCETTFETSSVTWEGEVSTPSNVIALAGDGTLIVRSDFEGDERDGFIYAAGFEDRPVIRAFLGNQWAQVQRVHLSAGALENDWKLYEIVGE